MKFAAWNIRGMNASYKYNEISKVIVEYKLSLLCLLETKVASWNVNKIKRKCIPNWKLLHNCPSKGVGKVWFVWDDRRLEVNLV